MLNLLTFLLICAIIAVFVDRRVAQRVAEQERSAAALAADAQPITTTFAQSWRSLFPHPKPPVEGERFRLWAVQALADQPELQAWLQSLPPNAMQALTAHVADFCADMEIELTWLLDQQLEEYPAVAQALTRIVSLYAQACYAGVLVQDDVAAMIACRNGTGNGATPPANGNSGFSLHDLARLPVQWMRGEDSRKSRPNVA